MNLINKIKGNGITKEHMDTILTKLQMLEDKFSKFATGGYDKNDKPDKPSDDNDKKTVICSHCGATLNEEESAEDSTKKEYDDKYVKPVAKAEDEDAKKSEEEEEEEDSTKKEYDDKYVKPVAKAEDEDKDSKKSEEEEDAKKSEEEEEEEEEDPKQDSKKMFSNEQFVSLGVQKPTAADLATASTKTFVTHKVSPKHALQKALDEAIMDHTKMGEPTKMFRPTLKELKDLNS